MNRQTKWLLSIGRGTRMVPGARSPIDAQNGSCTVGIDRPVLRGVCIDSHAERKAHGRKPWQGNPGSCRKEGVKVYEQY